MNLVGFVLAALLTASSATTATATAAGTVTAAPTTTAAPAEAERRRAPLTLEKEARGEAASRLFAAELWAHLDDGYAVTAIGRDDGAVWVELVGAETVLLSAEVDSGGRIRSTGVLSGPRPRERPASQFVGEELIIPSEMHGVATLAVIEDDGEPRLILVSGGEIAAEVTLGALEPAEFAGE